MADWFADDALRIYGFTEAEIAQINAVKDDLQHVLATVQAIMPRINRLIPVAVMVAARVNQEQKDHSK